jgi:hypothetical protein
MIATAWDDVPQSPGPQPEMNIQEPSLQYKLGVERIELAQKIEKLKSFMTTNPAFKELSYRHSRLLEEQLASMQMYEGVLVQRMTLLNNPNNNN